MKADESGRLRFTLCALSAWCCGGKLDAYAEDVASTAHGGALSTAQTSADAGGSSSTQSTSPEGGHPTTAPVVTGGSGGAASTLPSSGGATASQWIFFDSLRSSNRSIFAIRRDGGGLRPVSDTTSISRHPAVSPDGKRMAFASDRDGGLELYVMELPSGPAIRLTTGSAAVGQIAWSPEGKRLAFHRGAGIYLINQDGSGEHALIEGRDEASSYSNPAFTASGSTLLLDRYNQIEELSLATGTLRFIVNNTTTTIQHPSISPDGTTVVCSITCEPGATSLWLVPYSLSTDACHGGVRLDNGHFPSFGPDGAITFETGDSPPRIAVRSADGITSTITNGSYDDRNPEWAPAGFEF